MNRIDQLIENYRSHIQMPLRPGLAAAQRVWFAVYPAVEERRLVNRIDEFEMITKAAGHLWVRIDLKGKLAEWIGSVDEDERADWFKHPDDIDLYSKTAGRDVLTDFICQKIIHAPDQEHTVFALTGLMELYDFFHVSDLIEGILKNLPGHLLVFFPGEREDNTYRFLDARKGWDYLAVPILSSK